MIHRRTNQKLLSMKAIRLLLMSFATILCSSNALQGQFYTYFEDFESYKAGDKVSEVSNVIRTWNNDPKADAYISDEQAHSGSLSLKLESTAQEGGPSDIIVPLLKGARIYQGRVEVRFWMYIPKGKAAYYNFQGLPNDGEKFPLEAYYREDSTVVVFNDQGRAVIVDTSFDLYDQWFEVFWSIDLDGNFWRLHHNGTELGFFGTEFVGVASMDLYPVDQIAPYHSLFYIDDIDVKVFPFNPKNLMLDAAALPIILENDVVLTGMEQNLSVPIRNVGSFVLFEIKTRWSWNNFDTIIVYEDLFLKTKETDTFPGPRYVAGTEDDIIRFEILGFKGGKADEDSSNNVRLHPIQVAQPAQDKAVFIEEATGTWCGWCPRGAVYMERLRELFGERFVGVAVHGGRKWEPMRIPEYDAFINDYIDGYPSMVVNRKSSLVIDPLQSISAFALEVQEEPKAKIDVEGIFNADDRSMVVNVEAVLKENLRGPFYLGAILVEDSVRGNDERYSQANYYSGRNVQMGGYEKLPDPVPYQIMVYNDVARSVFGSVDGVRVGARRMQKGDTLRHTFTLEDIPEEWDEKQLSAVGYLRIKTSPVENAIRKPVRIVTSTARRIPKKRSVQLLPNTISAGQTAYLRIQSESSNEVQLRLTDIHGKTLRYRNYGTLHGSWELPIPAPPRSGVYLIEVRVGSEHYTKKLVVQ